MRREESGSRSRHDLDDRWRMPDTGDRYSYDRRDDQRRGGDPRDTRDDEQGIDESSNGRGGGTELEEEQSKGKWRQIFDKKKEAAVL